MEHAHTQHFGFYMEDRVLRPTDLEEAPSLGKNAKKKKKNSLWNWAPLRAISHILQQRFPLTFFIFVQSIDYIPSCLEGRRLIVQCTRKEQQWQTMPSRVLHGLAEFEEALHIQTTIYGRKVRSNLRFMPKELFLSVVALDTGEQFLCDHGIDLSCFLPSSMEKLQEPEKPPSFTKSFQLTGKAQGAVLVVTFDFEISNKEVQEVERRNSSARFGGSPLRQALRGSKSLPNSPSGAPFVRRSNYHFPSPCSSVNSNDDLYIEKLDLNSSIEETEDWSAEDYSSSDEERFRALKNDPLNLDASTDTEPVTLSTLQKLYEGLGIKGDSCTEVHSVSVNESLKSKSLHRTIACALRNHIDMQWLLDTWQLEKRRSCIGLIGRDIDKPFIVDGNHKATLYDEEDEFSFSKDTSTKHDLDVSNIYSPEEGLNDSFFFPKVCEENVDSSCWSQKVEYYSTSSEIDAESALLSEEVPTICDSKENTSVQAARIDNAELPRELFILSSASIEADSCADSCQSNDECLNDSSFVFDVRTQVESGVDIFYSCRSNGEASFSFERAHASADKSQNMLHHPACVIDLPDDWMCLRQTKNDENLDFLSKTPVNFSHPNFQVGADNSIAFPEPKKSSMEHVTCECRSPDDIEEGSKVRSHYPLEVGSKMSRLSKEHGCNVLACKDEDSILSVEADAVAFEDEDSILSVEADAVAEDFFDFLEKEGKVHNLRSEKDAELSYCFSPDRVKENFSLEESPVPELTPKQCALHSTGNLNSLESPLNTSSGDDHLSPSNLLSFIEVAESEMKKAAQSVRSKARAKMLEDAETEALMKEWGLTDKAFQSQSPEPSHVRYQRFPLKLPAAENMTPLMRLKDGGCLSAMSLDLFQGCTNLVMQASKAIVLPTEEGSSVLDILRSMASKGLENLAIQALLTMPLEDLAGMTFEQLAEKETVLDNGHAYIDVGSSLITAGHTSLSSFAKNTRALLEKSKTASGLHRVHGLKEIADDLVSLEEFALVALKRSEALVLEGLKIQCDMAEQAPYRLDSFSQTEMTEDEIELSQSASKVASSSRLCLDHKAEVEQPNVGYLLDMTMPLEEWIQQTKETHKYEQRKDAQKVKASRVLFPQYPNSRGEWGLETTLDVSENLTWQSLNDNLTVAMLLQLRDPIQYYEPIGASLMALVQAQKVIPSSSDIVAKKGDAGVSNNYQHRQKAELDQVQPDIQLKITGIHVCGLKFADENKKGWGSKRQLHLGSQWLLTNYKASYSMQPDSREAINREDVLWSISNCATQTCGFSPRKVDFCPHIRNPDLIFVNDTIVTW